MSAAEQAFRRIPGDGWLVLAGSLPELGGPTAGLMDRLLQHLDLSRPLAAIAASDADPDQVNEFLESVDEWLGTEAGYLELDSDLETEGWENSGLLVLVGEDPGLWSALEPAHLRRLRSAIERGALVLAVSGAGGALGSMTLSPVREGVLAPGLEWLEGAIVVGDPVDLRRPEVAAWLQEEEPRLALHLEPGSILALGPEQQVERWGGPAPEIVLGSGWTRT